MPKTIITSSDIELDFGGGSADYSGEISEARLEIDAAEEVLTNFASGGWKELTAGEFSATFTLTLIKDANLSGLDLDWWTAFIARSAVPVLMLKDGGSAIAAANVQYEFSVVLTKHLAGAVVNKVMGGTVTLPVTGTITRNTGA